VKVDSGTVKNPFLNKELKHQYLKAKKAANFIGDKNRKNTNPTFIALRVCPTFASAGENHHSHPDSPLTALLSQYLCECDDDSTQLAESSAAGNYLAR
jgi:hypothetical protein